MTSSNSLLSVTVILFSLFSKTIHSGCGYTYCAVEITGSYPTILPRGDNEMAVGYDESSDAILLLGGYHNRQQLITFDGTTFTDEGTTYISGNENIRGTGQYYSQLENGTSSGYFKTVNHKLFYTKSNA
eukprot:235874_1